MMTTAAASLAAAALAFSTPAPAVLHDQRVEYLSEPLGVDVARPRFSWGLSLVAPEAVARGRKQTSYRITLGKTAALAEADLVWDSGAVASNRTHLIQCAHPLRSDTQYFWAVESTLDDGSVVSSETPATFTTGLFANTDWNATWISADPSISAPLFRKEFKVPAALPADTRVTLFVAGIGYNEIYLNGNKLGDHKLDSGWTDFKKRVLYSTYDLTGLVARAGAPNALGVALGNGWWSCGPPPGTSQPACAKEPPQLLVQLHAGGSPLLLSDTSWRAAPSAISYNSLYNGEHFDGRAAAALSGWSRAGFDDAAWSAAVAAASAANTALLSSALFEPTRHVAELTPRGVTMPGPGVQVFDFGQNIAGVVRLRGLRCAAGANVTIRHAELLTHPPYGPRDGSIYVGNLRGAQATDVYTCRGDAGGEEYTPTFTQHGFRYAEVRGLAQPLGDEQVTALEMHTDVRQHGALAFSLPMLNQIQHMVVWGQKANVMSGVPTDCPQRDERRGWTGDSALTAEEAVMNYAMGAVYTRWLLQFEDDQTADGASNNFVPALNTGDGAPNWQAAYPNLVWALYTYYGDAGAAEAHHDSLARYYDHLHALYNASARLADYPTGFADWVPANNVMGDKHLIGAFALLRDLQLGRDFFGGSRHPGAAAQASRCAALLAQASADFHAAFFNATAGYYGSGLQTEQALPLYLGIVPPAVRARVLAHLVEDIVDTHGAHTTSGIIGVKAGFEALSRAGRTDVVLAMLAQESFPSYGYMLKGGALGADGEPATTLWELWASDQQGPGMNSRNHIMFGSVGSWFYKALLGVTPLAPGYATVGVRPTGVLCAGCNLTAAWGSLATPRGAVAVSWARRGVRNATEVNLTVSVPLGARARIGVPAAAAATATVTEGGAVVWTGGKFVPGVRGVASGAALTDGEPCIEFDVVSGVYAFTSLSDGP